MLNIFWKLAIVLITINAFMYFVVGGGYHSQYNSEEFAWLPSSINPSNADANFKITSSSQTQLGGFANADTNSAIEDTAQGGSTVYVPKMFTFTAAASFIFDVGFNIMFGYFVWMQMIIPFQPIVFAIAIPLFLFQMIGLIYLLQMIVSALSGGLSLFR